MKSLASKLAILLFAALGCVAIAVAASPEQSIASGNIDQLIRALSGKNDAASLNLLSRAYYAIEHFDESVAAGEKAVALGQGNATYHWWLGREYGEKAAAAN